VDQIAKSENSGALRILVTPRFQPVICVVRDYYSGEVVPA
jgi:hypothetical protein